MYDLVIINSHPIQYFAPLYAELVKIWDKKVCVLYASKRGIAKTSDEGFGKSFSWDVDLLSGYESFFLDEADANTAKSTLTISCRSLDTYLDKLNPKSILVHGYADPVAKGAIKWGEKRKKKIFLRGDTWSGPGETKGYWRRKIKRIWLKNYLVPKVDKFLAVGERNKNFWIEIGANKKQVKIVPYGIDTNSFKPIQNKEERQKILKRYGLSESEKIIGYFGKFVEKKGIYPLLKAFKENHQPYNKTNLILVGDGHLKNRLKIITNSFPINVIFLGFINQKEIPSLYSICDLVLVPSPYQETWGFVVQEALACGSPVLVSDTVGCVPDLVTHEMNGWILPANDWDSWVGFLELWFSGEKKLKGNPHKWAKRINGFHESAIKLIKAVNEQIEG